MSPQEEIFGSIFSICSKLKQTYNYLPGIEAKTPFIYVGEQFSRDQANKMAVFGSVDQTIHFYNDRRNRGDLTRLMGQVVRELRSLKRTKSYSLTILSLDQQVLYDNVGASKLLHGIIEVRMHFSYMERG